MGSCCGKSSPRDRERITKLEEESESSRKTTETVVTSHGSDTVDGAPVTHSTSEEDFVSSFVEVPPTSAPGLIPIRFCPASKWSSCAYCDNPQGDRYDYFFCRDMPYDLLEDFMEHGWWRTGQVIFKPRFSEVCCPSYALRMPAAQYVPSKSHRRVIRKWSDFLVNGHPNWDERKQRQRGEDDVDFGHIPVVDTLGKTSELVQVAITGAVVGGEVKETLEIKKERENQEPEGSKKRARKPVTPGRGPDPNKPPYKKAKLLRAERRRQRPGEDLRTKPPPRTATLQELLQEHNRGNLKHRLEVKLLSCNPRDPQLAATLDRAYELYDNFQKAIHPGKVRFNSPEEFEWGFMNTVLKSPPDRLLGSYHMHYYIDGELQMISIIDILPRYFVSIYFIYNPEIRFMMPGIYTCIRELELTQNLQAEHPELVYYALGYYNHFSPKVSYKKQFGPQEVLCNHTNVFVPLGAVIPRFLVKRYIKLAEEDTPEKEGKSASIDNLVVLTYCGPQCFKTLSQDERNYYKLPLTNLIAEAGSSATHRFLIDFI